MMLFGYENKNYRTLDGYRAFGISTRPKKGLTISMMKPLAYCYFLSFW